MFSNWLRIRWSDARNATSIYLLFGLTLTNFILISHRFFLGSDSTFTDIFTNLWIYGLIFLLAYFPVSILIGYWHRRTQLKVEYMLKSKEMPLYSKMCRFLLDVQTGKASEQEAKEFRELLLKIEKKFDVD